jgi:hypothetical protein
MNLETILEKRLQVLGHPSNAQGVEQVSWLEGSDRIHKPSLRTQVLTVILGPRLEWQGVQHGAHKRT